MASRFYVSLFSFIVFTTIFTHRVTALQVTPNSPCASFCVDSDGLDLSDPGASNTENGDITCYDSEYTSSAAGRKFQWCISCLQDSSFAQGKESDQLWFLYNLRYTFDYCVFGFPDAKDVASTPCSTSTACGELQDALTSDGLRGDSAADYSYCTAGGGAMAGEAVEKCLACVGASDDQDYLANYIVALEAGCKQQPPAGVVLGLNDTVFSHDRIGATDPTTDIEDDEESTPSTGTIAGIAVGAGAVALAIAGFVFVRCRKRRNRRLRLEGGRRSGSGGEGSSGLQGTQFGGPTSPLSFRCQTSLSPRSPDFHGSITAPSDGVAREKGQGYFAYAASSPVSPPMTPSSMCRVPPRPLREYQDPDAKSKDGPALHSITTTATPAFPGNVHYPPSISPQATVPFAPFSPDDDVAPPSTVSTRSTAQMLPLRPYNPAEYGPTAPVTGSPSLLSTFSPPLSQQQSFTTVEISSPESVYASPTSGSTSSPLLSRAWGEQQPGRGSGGRAVPTWDVPQWHQHPKYQRDRQSSNIAGTLGKAVTGKGGKRTSGGGNCSPVQTTQINIVFPAPPRR